MEVTGAGEVAAWAAGEGTAVAGAPAVGVLPSPPQAETMTTNANVARIEIEDGLSISDAPFPVPA